MHALFDFDFGNSRQFHEFWERARDYRKKEAELNPEISLIKFHEIAENTFQKYKDNNHSSE